jgi:hypothetical protein
MLVPLAGKENDDRVELLEQCYASYKQVKDLRVVYEIRPQKSSILNVKLPGEFIWRVPILFEKYFSFPNLCNLQLLSNKYFS